MRASKGEAMNRST